MLKQLSAECSNIVSTKQESLLRKSKVNDIRNLTFTNICQELKDRTPLLYSIMMTIATPNSRKKIVEWYPSISLAAAILLKQRCRMVNSVQLIVMIIMKYCGFQVLYFLFLPSISHLLLSENYLKCSFSISLVSLQALCRFLSSMKLGTSASYFNKKCDEFGRIYNEKLCEDKLSDEKVMKKSVEPLSHVDKETTTDHAFAVTAPCGHAESQPKTKHSECINPADSPDKENMLSPGCKYVIDNFDM